MTPADDRRVRTLMRRVSRARQFPINTCAASRLVESVGRALVRDGRSALIQDDPREIGEMMLWTVLALWRARDAQGRVAPPPVERAQ
jgi:hypothetical protein